MIGKVVLIGTLLTALATPAFAVDGYAPPETSYSPPPVVEEYSPPTVVENPTPQIKHVTPELAHTGISTGTIAAIGAGFIVGGLLVRRSVKM